jgi:hypothetical protein
VRAVSVDLELEHEDGRPKSVGDVLGAMDPSELVRMADQVRELEQHPGWRFLEALTNQHMRKMTDRLTDSPLSGIEAYAYSAGVINGFKQQRAVRGSVLKTAGEVAAANREMDR